MKREGSVFFFSFSQGNCYSKRFNFASVDLKCRSTSPRNQKMKTDLQLVHKHRLVLRVRSTQFFLFCAMLTLFSTSVAFETKK